MLERLIADGLAGRFPAEEVDILNWKEMLKRAQDLQLIGGEGCALGSQRDLNCAEPAGQRHRLAVSDPGQNRSQDRTLQKKRSARPTV